MPDGPPVAVLSYAFWTHAFGADPSVVGRSLLLRGEPYTVVGVMPRRFLSTSRADVWRRSPVHEGRGRRHELRRRSTEAGRHLAAGGRGDGGDPPTRAAEYREPRT